MEGGRHKMTYEERVRQIAGEMAEILRPRNWPVLTEEAKQDYTSGMVPAARIAIKHMAEAFEEGARWSQGWSWLEYELPDQLKENGLISPKEVGKMKIDT